MKSFKDKVAAISGAASGMGRELAIELAKQGCHLSLSDVNAAGLEDTARLAAKTGIKITTAIVDVSNRDAMFAWAEQTAKDHGKVNLIFNNAGVALGALLETVSAKDYQWIVGINFWGVVWGTQAFMPYLKKSGDGHVINTSSSFGLVASPTQGTYNSTKFAVRGFTEALRQELDLEDCGVSATCVHPGGIRTEIARSARMDESVARLSKGGAEAARKRFDKFLNLTSANSAAQQILKAVLNNRRRVLVGWDAVGMDLMARVLGSWYQPLTTHTARQLLFKSR